MATESKKHHFVPRSILKNFQNEDGKLFVFDKLNSKSFPSNADNSGHENNFNTISLGEEKINFEDVFQDVDNVGAILIKKILLQSRSIYLNEEDSYLLAYVTWIQQIRTKLYRTNSIDILREIHNWINELEIGKYLGRNISNVKIPTENESKTATLLGFKNFEEPVELLLSKRTLVVFRAPADYPFWISDNPVVMYNPFPYANSALKVLGTEVYFPIAKNILISFVCNSTCQRIYEEYWRLTLSHEIIPEEIETYFNGIYRNQIIDLKNENVEHLNSLQVQNSSRFIYSNLNEFGLAKDMISEIITLRETKTTIAVGKESKRDTRMPMGDHLVFYMSDEHFTIACKIENNKGALTCYSSDDRLKTIYKEKRVIDTLEIFEDQIKVAFKREMVITEMDIKSNRIVIEHENKGLRHILEQVKSKK